MKNGFLALVFFLFAARLDAGVEMARVVRVIDGATLVVEIAGKPAEVKLAGITITNAHSARELLRWTLERSWLTLERLPDGTAFVYRSPDGMFVNRELVARGFARPTRADVEKPSNLRVTYLGELDAPGPALSAPSPEPEPRPQTRSDKSRRSSTSRRRSK